MAFHHLRAPRPAAAPPAAHQPGPVTMALRAMLADIPTPPPSGPVTDAIRTMRAADPAFDADPDLRMLRRALADRIKADIAALDMLGGDPDFEPYLSSPDEVATCGRTRASQEAWGAGSRDDREDDGGDNGEVQDEDGGDIQDEPHDAEEDDDRDSGCGDHDGAVEQFGARAGHWGAFA